MSGVSSGWQTDRGKSGNDKVLLVAVAATMFEVVYITYRVWIR